MIASSGWFEIVLHHVARGAEMVGVAVILAGAVVACLFALSCMRRGAGWDETYRTFRITLARGILLGLEFLVAADIIGTVAVEPTLDNLYVLGVIVLIRTFLSLALEVEIDGRWPWRRSRPD